MPPTETRLRGRIGDPLQGVRQPQPIILPDTGVLFARRAERLLVLAEGHVMADWLRFMARIAWAQHAAAERMTVTTEDTLPLAPESHVRDPAWREALTTLLDAASDPTLPEQAAEVAAQLREADAETLADAYLAGRLAASQAGAALYIAASLQVYFASLASSLVVETVHLQPQRGLCPVCGSAPVSGVITAAGRAPGVRYLHCGLCATAWNHVRAVCINCGESGSLALHEIEGGNGAVKAETCDACHGYAKMLHQERDMQVDPVADDLASLALDILVGECGWSRHAPNPLIIGA